MVLDPTSATPTAVRTERPDAATLANEPERVRPERPEAGQTSETAPAVVANISAAALEIARPVNEAQQAADESRARKVAEEEQRDRNREAEAQNISRAQEEARRSRLDVVV